mgnify:CR=1 FL=1
MKHLSDLNKLNEILKTTEYIVYFDRNDLLYYLLKNYENTNISSKSLDEMITLIIDIIK